MGKGKRGSQGNSGGKAGSAPGQGGGANPMGRDLAEADGAANPAGRDESPEEANEEFSREAANLVLRRLQKELERGEVDQELLDELGWTPEQLKKFVERMQRQLEEKPDDSNSPQAKARQRQFEEMLQNINLSEKSQRRNDTNKEKQAGEGIGSVRRPPPAEYRDVFESVTKGFSKKKSAEAPKK
jgi:hypothetical protein